MTSSTHAPHLTGATQPGPGPFAIVLGTNETASAIAIALRRAGFAPVLADAPHAPVLRRGMAFHDALFEETIVLDGISAERCDTAAEVRAVLAKNARLPVTAMGLLELIVLDKLDVLIDARLQPVASTPDLRWLAALSLGVGAGFRSGQNCDLAIDPAAIVQLRPADIQARRTLRATAAGVWRTPVEIGTHIFKDFVLGHIGACPLRAPMDGVIVGAVRDGAEVAAGAELVEIDRRVRKARWRGPDPAAQAIAATSLDAIHKWAEA